MQLKKFKLSAFGSIHSSKSQIVCNFLERVVQNEDFLSKVWEGCSKKQNGEMSIRPPKFWAKKDPVEVKRKKCVLIHFFVEIKVNGLWGG